MAHARKQVRDALVTAITGLTTTGSRVYRHRYYPLAEANLPGLIVYTEEESQDYLTVGSDRTIQHTLSLRVEAFVKATTNYDDVLDQINLEVSDAIFADRTLGGLAKDTRLLTFSASGDVEGEQPAFVGRFDIQISYMTKESDPETAA